MRIAFLNSNLLRQASGFFVRACWAAVVVLAVPMFSPAVHAQDPNAPRRRIEILPSATPYPDANERARMEQSHKHDAAFDAANAERKREIAQETAILLRLAGELKAALDSNKPEEIALTVRKAELIERLARNVQEKMKLAVYAR